MASDYPSRIVCLSAEAADLLCRLNAQDRIVGVTAFAPMTQELSSKPRVSGFSSVNLDKIDSLKPDLIITFSDVQADATRELIRRGHTVLATNQRSLVEIFQTITLVGRLLHKNKEASQLVAEMERAIFDRSTASASRPRVYFEEWDEPLITGICWVSELIEAAGGCDIFSELRSKRSARERVVSSEEIIRRGPDIIIASWCGKKVDRRAISNRIGWNDIPAVQHGCMHEIDSNDILQPGVGLLKGFAQLCEIVSHWATRTGQAIAVWPRLRGPEPSRRQTRHRNPADRV